MPDIFGVISVVELWNSSESRDASTLQDRQALNLVLKEVRDTLKEGGGESARESLTTEVSEETVSVERLIPKEEKRHLGRHLA